MRSAKRKGSGPVGPPERKLPNWIVLVPVLVPLAMYVYTAAPSLTLVDSGEFTGVLWTRGIGHPPGVPVYLILGHLFSLLPLAADIARRTTLFSSVSAAMAAGVCFLFLKQLLDDIDERLALAGSIAFGFSLALWGWAVVTEVYALNTLLLVVMLWMAARGRWAATAFAAGIAMGVHHVTIAMAVPAATLLLWTRKRPGARDLLLASAAAVAGLSVYLYLPWRAMQHPLFNWGDPSTIKGLWRHVSGQQYQSTLGAHSAANFFSREIDFLRMWFWQLAPPAFLLTLAGWIALLRRYTRMFWFCALLAGFNIAFVAVTQLGGPDVAGYYMPTFLAGIVAFVAGCDALVSKLGPGRKWIALTTIWIAALLPAVTNFQDNDRRNDTIATSLMENSMRGIPDGSLVVSSDWNFLSGWYYWHTVRGLNPGVIVIDTNAARTAAYLDTLERQYPDLMRMVAPELAKLRERLDAIETGRARRDDGTAHNAYVALIQALARVKLAAGVRVFAIYPIEVKFFDAGPVSPHGLVFELADASDDTELDFTGILAGGHPLDESQAVQKNSSYMLFRRAVLLLQAGETARAKARLELAMQLDPENKDAAAILKAMSGR